MPTLLARSIDCWQWDTESFRTVVPSKLDFIERCRDVWIIGVHGDPRVILIADRDAFGLSVDGEARDANTIAIDHAEHAGDDISIVDRIRARFRRADKHAAIA